MSKVEVIDLASLVNELQVKEEAEHIKHYCTDDKGDFIKSNAQNFLDQAEKNIESKNSSPESKLMTMLLFKQFTERKETKLLAVLANSKFLKKMGELAINVDAKKSADEKGFRLYPEEPEIGNKFMRVMLQCLIFWGNKYARGRNSQETRFAKILNQLKQKKVVLPTNYMYLDESLLKKPSEKPNETIEKESPAIERKGNLKSELDYTKDRIDMFYKILQDEDEEEQLQRSINSNHNFFEKQFEKYQSRMKEIQNVPDEQVVDLYFNIHHFLDEEKKAYSKNIPNNDIKAYKSEVKALCLQTGIIMNNPVIKEVQQKPNMTAMIPSKSEVQSKKVVSISTENKLRGNNNPALQEVSQKVIVSNIMSRFQARSKSPNDGFKAVQKSLEKEKELAKQNPIRKTGRSPSPINRSQARLKLSNLKESKITQIFSQPPNPSVYTKVYQGDLIMGNKDLQRVYFSIRKQQGNKKFKMSNFKQKSAIFQNDHIEVGYKSQPIYQNIQNFRAFLSLNLFIGNKTDQTIRDFQIEYKSDSNQLLYASPKNIDSVIPPGYQNKHDLMITPMKVPFSFMIMNVSYNYRDRPIHTTVALPNSVLKFASYMSISISEYEEYWGSGRIFKSQTFPLCKYIAPDKLNKWIPALNPLTSYEDFAQPGSEADFQVFCKVILLQIYEAIVKIIIRPNLKVIIQLTPIDEIPEALEYMKAYIQTLELVLKEND